MINGHATLPPRAWTPTGRPQPWTVYPRAGVHGLPDTTPETLRDAGPHGCPHKLTAPRRAGPGGVPPAPLQATPAGGRQLRPPRPGSRGDAPGAGGSLDPRSAA